MKMKNLILLAVCLLGGFALTSCDSSNDDPLPPMTEGKANMILAIDMAPQASMGYIVPVQNTSNGNVSFTNAHEVKSTPYLATYKDWVFSIGGAADANVYKFIRNDDGTLTKAGQIQVDRMAPMAGNMLVVNDTKAYATAPIENKIVIFNPTTMERTGEIDLADSRWGAEGSNTPNPIGLFLRDNILYVGLGQFDNMPICKKGAHVLLVDATTDKPIKKIVDYRLSAATVIGVGAMFVDEKNDLYIPCWGSYGYVPDQYCGLLRIKNGETDFDKDYCFNLTDRTWTGVEGGKLQYVLSYHYAGNGELYFFGYCPAFIGASGPDYINDKTNYAFKANLYNCTGEVLDFPRTNGYSCAINHKDSKVFFGLVTETNGAGLFVYDRNTKTCSQSPVIKTQGTIMDMVIY